MTVGIVGLGLIGASFARGIRGHLPHRILAAERKPEILRRAMEDGLVEGELTGELMKECDLVLLALYPGAICHWLRENAPLLSSGCTVIDAGGLKEEICRVGFPLAKQYGFTFIGGHPMAGREVWGYESATDTLFRGASMILTPAPEEVPEAVDLWRQFFLEIGFGSVTVKTPEDHDRIIAYTSQLAHVLSSAYIFSPTAEEHQGLSAGSFRDMTRVAAINEEMWSEIFLSNRENLLAETDRLIENLSEYRRLIAEGDRENLKKRLRQGAERKAALLSPEKENAPRGDK